MSETPEPVPESLVAELRRLVTPLPDLLEEAPEHALDQVRHTARWVLQQVLRSSGGDPGKLRYPDLFAASQPLVPRRIRIQFQTIQFYGTAEERAHEGPSDISRTDVLPCLQALENVVQWFLSEYLKTNQTLSVLPEPATNPPRESSTKDRDLDHAAQQGTKANTDPGHPSSLAPLTSPLIGSGRSPLLLAALAMATLLIVGLFLLQVDDLRRYSDRRIGVIMEETAGGILISSVQDMGPADRGGLVAGDLLLEIDGRHIEQFSDFDASTENFHRGTPARIRILREGQEFTLEIEPGLAMNWSQPMFIAFSMGICLLFAILGLYNRPLDLRTRLLSAFLLMVALELSLSLESLPPGLEILHNLLFFLLNGSEIAVTLHLAALIPERQSMLRRHPWLVPLFYVIGQSIAAIGWIPVLQEAGFGNLLPWGSAAASLFLNEFALPLWALTLLLILLRPALHYPEIQGRQQARLAFLGFVPWSLGYILTLSVLRALGHEGPLWLMNSLPLLVLFFPAAIATVILLEAHNHRKILMSLTQEIRRLDTVAEMTDLVATDLEAAFHPRGLHVFFQHEQSDELTLGHSTGLPSRVHRIPHHFEVTRRAEDSGRILNFPEDLPDLPEEEHRWLQRLGIRLIVPVNDSRRDLVGLLLLGEKRSEEGYSRSDLRLLHSLAGQIALSFENLGLQNRLGEKTRVQREVLARLQEQEINLARECPVCGRCYDCTVEECPQDGSEVVLAVPVERIIGARYRLERVLGKGGVGSVYQATDLRLNRQVAVKVLLGSALDNPLAQRRFEREARVVAQLDHPNIVTVFDFGRTEVGNAFIVLELLEGITLRSALRHRGAIAPATLANWFGQILEGLRAAHRNGVIHRDLKPGNVFITRKIGRDEVVKLLDFGIAKIKSGAAAEPGHLTLPGVILGTIGYMAPEQVLGDEIDERADLYSVGVMALECLRGHRPFHGRSPIEVLSSLADAPLQLAVDFNEELANIIERCLERDPAKRFPSAEELQVALITTLKTCSPLSASPSSQDILADLSTSDSTLLEPGVQRGPTEKVNLTGQMESYLQELRSELKSRNKET